MTVSLIYVPKFEWIMDEAFKMCFYVPQTAVSALIFMVILTF